jgi:hypothetical protein
VLLQSLLLLLLLLQLLLRVTYDDVEEKACTAVIIVDIL